MSTVAASKVATRGWGIAAAWRGHLRLWSLAAIVSLWVLLWILMQGSDTLAIGGSDLTDVHQWLKARATWVEQASASGTNVFINLANSLADSMNALIVWLQQLFTIGKFPRPLPQIGWLGTLSIAAWVALAAAGWRSMLLVVGSFLAFGFLGYWADSLDTLIVTLVAVLLAIAVGIPLGIWMAHSRAVTAIVTPVLDVMQTMPSLVYLLPIAILFGIGPAAASIVTLIYAAPPVVRITAYAIREVSPSTVEATTSLGQNRWQRLKDVELPMAKRTIIVGVNQTMMAALSMATIAAFIDGPGLGQPVLEALRRGQLGKAFVSGIALVIMAIMLDRTTTAASVRAENAARTGDPNKVNRRYALAGAGVLAVVAVVLSNRYAGLNEFPTNPDLGTPLSDAVDSFGQWLRSDLSGTTVAIQESFSLYMLNPIQELLANSPWYVTALAICGIAVTAGGARALIAALICLTGIYLLDLWNNAMITMTAVLVATAVVMVLATLLGVWMGRNSYADQVLRPFLDAGQTLPPFVYLIPIFILFGANRFTAIVAGVIYAAPPAIKLVADGIRGVSSTTIEAAESAGTSRLQMITKVQLPMARGSFLLAANQGLLYVLSMVVIGGMAGAGALGFDVVSGFRQANNVGRGLAAGITIVLLGIMLDRITTYAAGKTSPATKRRSWLTRCLPLGLGPAG